MKKNNFALCTRKIDKEALCNFQFASFFLFSSRRHPEHPVPVANHLIFSHPTSNCSTKNGLALRLASKQAEGVPARKVSPRQPTMGRLQVHRRSRATTADPRRSQTLSGNVEPRVRSDVLR